MKGRDKTMNYNSHPKMKYAYIGIDCHKYTHTATIINCFNENLGCITFNNDLKGFDSLVKKVESVKGDLIAIFGLEDTKHLGYSLAEYLFNKNYRVKHINSNLTYAERKKNPIIYKNDEFDSYCIAKVLLDELDNLTDAENNEIYWTLKQVVKMRDNLVKSNINLKNKLHAQLLHHYPNYNRVFADLSSETCLVFFENYPSPNLLTTKEDLSIFLKENTKSRQYNKFATKIFDLIQEYEIYKTDYQEQRNSIIKLLIQELKENNRRLKDIEKTIENIYDRIGKKLHTIPGISKVYAASILAEIGNVYRFSNSGKLARYAGIAPNEKSSGGKDVHLTNQFGNRNLNSLIYYICCISLSTGKTSGENIKANNPIFREYYQKKISEGKTKHQAIICIMRRLTNIIYKILKEDREYQTPTELLEQSIKSFRERKKLEEEKLNKKKILKEKRKSEKNLLTSTS